MKTRGEYTVDLVINGRRISKVIIDPHYELKHASTINDSVIPKLVSMLSGESFEPDSEVGNFQYFVADGLELGRTKYRLVRLLERNQIYVGVVNAYRRK